MMKTFVAALVTIITASITAYSTIQVAALNARQSAAEDRVPNSAKEISAAIPQTVGSKALGFSVIGDNPQTIQIWEDGILLVVANASGVGGGEFRSYLDLSIEIDGKVASQVRSYVPVNWGVGHQLNSTCIVPVYSNRPVTVLLKRGGEGLKSSTVSGTYAVIPVHK